MSLHQNAPADSQPSRAMKLDGYSIKTIEYNKLMKIDNLNFNTEYQRMIESARLKKIIESIKIYGYWPFEVVILNEKHEVIDGQHRAKAAKMTGVESIPVCVVTFPNKKLEAQFFSDKNNYNTNLKPVDFWHARYLSGHPVAQLIYRFESDKSCNLHQRIAVKGSETKKTKFTINEILSMVCVITDLSKIAWRKDIDTMLTSKILNMGYDVSVNKINKLTGWLDSCFGSKGVGALAYSHETLRSILRLYMIFSNKGIADKSDTIKKMRTFIFTAELKKMSHQGRVYSMIAHYNKGKHDKCKLDYEPIEDIKR